MLFDQRDLGLLHLTGWCRHLSLSVLERFQSPMLSMQTLGPLADAHLLHITKDGKSLRLRAEGYALLDALGIPCPRDNKYPDSDTRTGWPSPKWWPPSCRRGSTSMAASSNTCAARLSS